MSKLYTFPQACRLIDVSEPTLRRMIARGEFRRPVRRGPRWVRFDASDIADYLAKLIADSREPVAAGQGDQQ